MASEFGVTHRIRHAAMAAVCLCLILLSHGHVPVRQRWAESVVAKLALVEGFRFIEPRTSLDLPHAPFRMSLSAPGYGQLRRTDPTLASQVAAVMAERAGSMAARRAADLLLADWDKTIDRLNVAAEEDSGGAHWLDLACAYYMRGLKTRSLNDFARALQCLGRSEPSARVTFNRALVLEQLRDREAAAAEWRAYLTMDPHSPWAAEAREHLRKDSRHTVAAKPSRKRVERDLLPAWGEAWLRGDRASAERSLSEARSIAARLARTSGDHFLSKIVAEIEQAPPERRAPLAAALTAYGNGRRAVEQQNDAKALQELVRAKRILADLRSAAELLPASYLVTARYLAGDYDGAERFANEVERCRSDCTAAVAHAEWIRGMILFHRGYPSASLASFSRALRGFERLGENDQQATQHTNLADTYQYLGDAGRAAVHRYHALVLTEEINDPRRLQPILSEAADAAASDGLPEAAFAFQDRVVRLARSSKDAFQIADALTVRSTLNHRIGRRNAALRDLDEARRFAAAVGDQASRQKIIADIDAAEAFAVRDVDDRRAIERLDRSIGFLRRHGSHIRLAQLLLERGRARLRLGFGPEAERDFNDGIAELEEQRRRVDDRELRIAYFDRAERLFSDLALLLLRRGRPAEAFEVLERSRARELLDSSTGRAMQPMPLDELQRRLGAGVAVVAYLVADDRVVAAIVTRDGLRFVERRIADDDLRHLVDRVSRGFDSDAGLAPRDLQRLHETLIVPLQIEPATRLVIVPDQFLYRVPFAALLGRNGRYLVEDHVLAVAPSATLHVRNVARDCTLAARATKSVLLVASPQHPEGFAALQPLRHTIAETASIAKLYPNALVVQDAGRDVFAGAAGYDAIHVASHAVLTEASPAGSMLLLGAKGRLRVTEIEALRFSRTRLVVLAACSSGIGKTQRGEGVLSLARAFMAASVPSVVGTVAPVEDAAAARLLTSFHGAYARGHDPASAIRHAQLAMLRSSHRSFADPARWSAFQAIGGACASANVREENKQWASH